MCCLLRFIGVLSACTLCGGGYLAAAPSVGVSRADLREPDCVPALVPMPREVTLTGGELTGTSDPKVERVEGMSAEGYELSVTPEGVTIRASGDAGEFYARQTLAQLKSAAREALPCCEIRDSPRFAWRGVHVDDVRHFMGKEAVKRTIGEISKFKFNVFHWHLTDEEAWLFEVPGYPELQEYGDRFLADKGQLPLDKTPRAAHRYYDAADIREILDYAAARHVTVVPEVEFPGHFFCALCAYPEFACDPEAVGGLGRSPMVNGVPRHVMCVGNPDAVKFIEKALDALCELFPSKVIHIGGDECRRDAWKDCPKCQALVKREALASVDDIQPWLTRHVVGYLAKKGRRAIGWDEMLDVRSGALPAAAMGMRWHPGGRNRMARAAQAGHEIVDANANFWYLDKSQGIPGDKSRYHRYGSRIYDLKTVYSYDPLAEIPEGSREKLIGGECCNWTEWTFDGKELEWKLWPRAMAVAEILWTHPEGERRDFGDFKRRAAVRRGEMAARGVNAAPVR